jgi:hypothetical protein
MQLNDRMSEHHVSPDRTDPIRRGPCHDPLPEVLLRGDGAIESNLHRISVTKLNEYVGNADREGLEAYVHEAAAPGEFSISGKWNTAQ